ncbi:antitoxin [Nonomuraea salmonea]|uniref:Antitoxin n=1 Tax=Nonomuraea salmonea TaxID=46181 RepID=A0ABV5NCC7_9ACTN
MSRIGEWLKKAENLARGHSKQADQIVDRAEQYAKERTGHKYDEHISRGADTVQRRYGGGQDQTGQPTDQPTGQQPGQPGRQAGQQPPPTQEEQERRMPPQG